MMELEQEEMFDVNDSYESEDELGADSTELGHLTRANYVDRVRSLTTLPETNKRRLEEICRDMRRRLMEMTD